MCQQRPHAHGIYPCLGPGVINLCGDISRAEYTLIVLRLQGVPHLQKTLLICRQTGLCNPGCGSGTSTPEQRIKRGFNAIGTPQAGSLHGDNPCSEMDLDTLLLQRVHHGPSCAAIVALQNLRRSTPQAQLCARVLQTPGHSECQFYTACSTAHQRDTITSVDLAPLKLLQQSLPALPETGDGFYRRGVCKGSRDTVEFRLGADINTDNVVRNVWPCV